MDFLATLGVGGALAGVIFYFHIQQDALWRERYEKLGNEFRLIVQANTQAITLNTEVVRELKEYVCQMVPKHDP